MPNIDWSQMQTAEQRAAAARKALVPQAISRAQGKAVLQMLGLWPGVEAWAETLEGEARIKAHIALYDTNEWRRDSPTVTEAAQTMGISPEQLDEMYIQAAAIML